MDPIFIFLIICIVLFIFYLNTKRSKNINKSTQKKVQIPTLIYITTISKKVLTIEAPIFEQKNLSVLRSIINDVPHYQIPRKEIYFHLFKYDEKFSKEFILYILVFNELGIVTWENLHSIHKNDKDVIEAYSKDVEKRLNGSTNLKESEHLITFMLETKKININNVEKYLSASNYTMNIFRKTVLKNICDFDYKELALITIKKNIKSFCAVYHPEQDSILMSDDIYDAIVNKLRSLDYTKEKFNNWVRGKFSVKFLNALIYYIEDKNIIFK